jgi:uncharacterized membrane protein
MIMPAKWIFQSKTFWLNVIGAAVFIVTGHAGVQVPDDVAALVLAIANIANRFLTVRPVTVSAPPPTS